LSDTAPQILLRLKQTKEVKYLIVVIFHRKKAGSMSPSRKRRRSLRGQSSNRLATRIVKGDQVVFITGAGLSVSSGVKPFRGDSGIWNEVIWKTATRACFRKDPLAWYNDFWLPYFSNMDPKPNTGHSVLKALQEMFPDTCHIITQNVDGLQQGKNVIEAHGRIGYFKCLPAVDSDTDSDDDDDDDRPVHLGHRRKRSSWKIGKKCRFQQMDSLAESEIEPSSVRKALKNKKPKLDSPPLCPQCRRPVPPQALLFDEGYHAHDFYQFMEMERLLANARVIVFIGTSFNVTITSVTLDHARSKRIPVFNFNTVDFLEPSARLDVENIVGKSDDTLSQLLSDVKELLGDSKDASNSVDESSGRI
jgi:NAD-dependent deacetylase